LLIELLIKLQEMLLTEITIKDKLKELQEKLQEELLLINQKK